METEAAPAPAQRPAPWKPSIPHALSIITGDPQTILDDMANAEAEAGGTRPL
ncbi:MAG: hypothetical protein GY769_18035 [bacterium]|nr:hypothetical protein [bacterium]